VYIRWKTRETKQGTTVYCYLCSGERVAGKVKSSTLGYLGSIAAKPSASQRAVFWETVAAKLLALELSREDRVRIEALIAQRVQRGKNPHGDADACVEWYTPPEFVVMARTVLGEIDLEYEEQREILRKIESYFAIIHSVEDTISTNLDELQVYNQSILAKAFRGELVPQDPNDEPASILLERIRAEREKLDTKKKAKGKTEKKSRKAKPEAAEPEQLSLPGFE
jgi:hypothetical protein